jgi:hypothetical protein
MAAKNKNNKQRTNHKASHKNPTNPSPQSGQWYVLSRVSFIALETHDVICAAARHISTTPHANCFSTGHALSNRYFHDYLSADDYT